MKIFNRRCALLFIAIVALTLTYAGPANTQSLTAEQIMNQSNNRDQGADFQSAARLTTTDAQGNSAEMSVDMAVKLIAGSAETGQPRYNILATVTAPDDSKGLAVLVHEQDFPTSDDIWLFLPAVGSAKNIVPENFRTPLFGSEFTFEELVDREPGLDTHELLREDSLGSAAVWVIRSVPQDQAVAGFAYRITFIDQSTLLPLRMELFDDFDTMIKLFTSEQVEVIDGIPTNVVSKAENLETGRTTTFEFIDPRYNQGGLSDDLFDPDNLGA